jgi:predicted TIM-barrel fold metal-dependent hydrolase
MIRHTLPLLLTLLFSAPAVAQLAPVADHHQHLFSPALVALLDSTGATQPITAHDVIALLDSAGIQKALLLSAAYIYGSPKRTVADEYARVRAENDWNAAQAAQYPQRLRAFCGFNPLKEYALEELERCARDPRLKRGIKLHFGNSDVQLENPEHIEKLRQVFRAANRHRMAIVVHLRASISLKRPYGPSEARAFLNKLLPEVPDVPVQVAHLAGSGPGYDDPQADSVMAVLAEAVEKQEPRTKRLLFDVTTVANGDLTPAQAALIVKRIRQVGVKRVLFGSDAATGENLRPKESWATFRKLPLTERELRTIANNVAPYLR